MSDPVAPTQTSSPPLPEAPGFTHEIVETPGLRTHVATIGDGEPVLLLHGCPEHWWQWRDIGPALAQAGYRAIVPDLRGAGWTSADDPRIERDTRLHDMVALLDALDVERCHLLSHDMGAITAMQLSYAHPGRVRRAVQLSVPPAFFAFSPRIVPGFLHLPSFIWHRPGASLASVFGPRYAARPMSPETIEAHLRPLRLPEVDAAIRSLSRRHVLPEAMRMLGGTYRRQHLTVPTRIVFGREDRPWTEANLGRILRHPERYADELETTFVPGAKHFITDDAPSEVAELTLEWFARG